MKFKIKQICCATMAAFMIFSSAIAVQCAENKTEISDNTNKQAEATTVYIVGDSTACIYGNDDDYAVPRAGWGMYLDKYLNKNAEVVDLALAGRSSKSFTQEENYQKLKDNLKAGDILLIQFGHNDAKNKSEEDLASRYTDPEGDVDTEGSFKNSLYNNYVKLAEEKGATPVLITPISRRKFKDGVVTDSHGKYDDAVRELAEEKNIEMIDATALTEDLYNKVGEETAEVFHAVYNDTSKGYDNTHLSHYGAMVVSALIASELDDTKAMGEYVSDDAISSDDIFKITRGDVAAFLARLIGYDEEGKYSFSDVDADNKNYKGIYNAKTCGIVVGDDKSKFNPDKEASVLDILLMASRAYQKNMNIDKADIDTSVLDNYKGKETIRDYAKADLAVLVQAGIITAEDAYTLQNDKADKAMLEAISCEIYDIKAAADNAEQAEIDLDELEKVENTK